MYLEMKFSNIPAKVIKMTYLERTFEWVVSCVCQFWKDVLPIWLSFTYGARLFFTLDFGTLVKCKEQEGTAEGGMLISHFEMVYQSVNLRLKNIYDKGILGKVVPR